MTLRIKNWKKFQHFKDRKPPWIKLYRDLLDDPDWHALDGEAAKLLTMLWLLASEAEGELPDVKKLAFRLRMEETILHQRLTKLSHWLDQDDITLASSRYQVDAPETEGETETDAAPKSARLEIVKGSTEEADLFTRGKKVLGTQAGGMIASLLKSKKGSVPLARAAIEQAATKQNPREYIGAVIRGPVHERHGANDPHAGII